MKLNDIGNPFSGIFAPYRETLESHGMHQLRCAKHASTMREREVACRMKQIMREALCKMLDEKLVTGDELEEAGRVTVERENKLFAFEQGTNYLKVL